MEPRKYYTHPKPLRVMGRSIVIIMFIVLLFMLLDQFMSRDGHSASSSLLIFLIFIPSNLVFFLAAPVAWDGSQWIFRNTKEKDSVGWRVKTLKLVPEQIIQIELEKFSTQDKKINRVLIYYVENGLEQCRFSGRMVSCNDVLHDLNTWFPEKLGPEARAWLATHPEEI